MLSSEHLTHLELQIWLTWSLCSLLPCLPPHCRSEPILAAVTKLCVYVTVLLQAVCWLWEGSTSAWLHSDVAVFCLPPRHFGRSLQGPQCGCGDSHIPAGWNFNADCRKGKYVVQMWQLWILKESKGTREIETHNSRDSPLFFIIFSWVFNTMLYM